MLPEDTGLASATIWQGYHHAWKYNHRLNRFGSYVRSWLANGERDAVIGHTAASGTGGDTARFSEYVTRVQVEGVGFQSGRGETTIECIRAETAPFGKEVDGLTLAPQVPVT
jgi:hypothetical protein